MPRFRKININFSRQKAGEFDAGVFWILILLGAAFILINAYSVYATTDLSYKIEGERRQIKKEEVQYQRLEEEYISRLESLIDRGKGVLGLEEPRERIFVDRRYAVARAGL